MTSPRRPRVENFRRNSQGTIIRWRGRTAPGADSARWQPGARGVARLLLDPSIVTTVRARPSVLRLRRREQRESVVASGAAFKLRISPLRKTTAAAAELWVFVSLHSMSVVVVLLKSPPSEKTASVVAAYTKQPCKTHSLVVLTYARLQVYAEPYPGSPAVIVLKGRVQGPGKFSQVIKTQNTYSVCRETETNENECWTKSPRRYYSRFLNEQWKSPRTRLSMFPRQTSG